MILEEIKKEAISADGAEVTVIPIGNGSALLQEKLRERLGEAKAYRLVDGAWKAGQYGDSYRYLYGLSARDRDLFNAYNYLDDGWETARYGDGGKMEEGYEYAYFNEINRQFFVITFSYSDTKLIYARRKKEAALPPEKKTININGYEVPEPFRGALKVGDAFYVADPTSEDVTYRHTWDGDDWDHLILKNGLIHISKKAAKKHSKALKSFTKSK